MAFLQIPRSYYGFLEQRQFDHVDFGGESKEKVVPALFQAFEKADIADDVGVVRLDVTAEEVEEAALTVLPGADKKLLAEIADIVLRGRYSNMQSMLKDNFTPEEYLRIVENKVLVDVQGKDILLQIFTAPVVLNKVGDQAPFFEFIERVCSKEAAVLQPGCGGFGIRNFLTLFLSIEVSNAMDALAKAKLENNVQQIELSRKTIEIFSTQMNVSNPVLTRMSDAMTAQSDCVAALEGCEDAGTKKELEKQIVE